MAEHQRKVIRHAVKDALIAASTVAAERVFPTRKLPLRRLELPAIAIYTIEDEVDGDSAQTAPRELQHSLPITIEAWVADSDAVDDDMDAMALQIENAMHADPYLGDRVGDSVLSGTLLEVVEIGDRVMGMVALTYDVTYRTLAPEAPTTLDDFQTVEATHNLGGAVHANEVAVDEFNIQEAP